MIRQKGNDIFKSRLDDESLAKYEHMQEKAAAANEKLKENMISHLSALNDGVIAIFITVMMLEIPFPTSRAEYDFFAWSVKVFFVSFFIIADFWYENKKIFQSMREADHLTIVVNFIFLAALALIPVTTKWILNAADKYAAINFGIVYFVTLLAQEWLRYAALRKRFVNHVGLFFRIIAARVIMLTIFVAVLLVLSYYYPRIAIMLYVVLPIYSFFRPRRMG